MPSLDVLELLEREDKWYLGGGRSLIWAPPSPVHADVPGFWDEAHYFDYPVPRLFTVTFLDQSMHPLPIQFIHRRWRPSHLVQQYSAGPDIDLTERKAALRDDVLVAEYLLRNSAETDYRIHVVAWTCQTSSSDGGDVVDDVDLVNEYLVYARRQVRQLRGRMLPEMISHVALGTSLPLLSYSVNLSEPNSDQPRWELTPFYEKIASGRLPNERKLAGLGMPERGIHERDGHLYLGLHSELTVPAGGELRFSVAAGVSHERARALHHVDATLVDAHPVANSIASWEEYFGQVPDFTCSDPYLERYYWYRWYGLRLNAIENPIYAAREPAVCEGIGGFRSLITYSAQCHMREARWMHRPDLARGSLLNFVDHQKEDGNFPANIYARYVHVDGMYHADWGSSVLEVDRVHPDHAFLERVYQPLVRYREYFCRERDPEESHLYDVVDQGETGQEYMSRYTAVDPNADHWTPIRLKGVDATVYLYQLERALATIARALGRPEATDWDAAAARTGKAIGSLMWDPEEQLFFDVDPRGMTRTGVKAAVCFYPYFTDLVGPGHLEGIDLHLLNSDEFWTPWPVPATAVSDPSFNAEAEWKGKRQSCPWNGRTWPMTNSHVVEAIARVAYSLDPTLRVRAAELIRRFVRMMFFDQDPSRPNCFEHYNPLTGLPSVYRGIDDYQHSWVVDLIIKYVTGIQPQQEPMLVVDPLPFHLDRFRIDEVPYRGHRLRVEWNASGGDHAFQISVDGHLAVSAPVLSRHEVDLRQYPDPIRNQPARGE
ncbi:MAG: hypothetical protein HYY04_15740 [Chloroflexi bacterium]|nr:hypothetical protein [Chloroflexota bacterium]